MILRKANDLRILSGFLKQSSKVMGLVRKAGKPRSTFCTTARPPSRAISGKAIMKTSDILKAAVEETLRFIDSQRIEWGYENRSFRS